MSEKKAKMDCKMSLVTNEAKPEDVAKDMAESIRKMYEDRDKKADGAKEHLVNQLAVTSDKYRTANGVMSALDTVRTVVGTHGDMTLTEEIAMAKTAATALSDVAQSMSDKAMELVPYEMDLLCQDFYDKEFSEGNASVFDMVVELMTLQLCQNVGPSAEDVVDFISNASKEIEKAEVNLKTYCADNELDIDEIYPTNLAPSEE